jgi:hypothetical protein
MQSTGSKRQKELARVQRNKEKEQRREQRKREKAERPARVPGEEDPDIAGIVAGPQPIPPEE